MAKIASDVLIERLADWGVDTVFGLPGDGINGIMEGLRAALRTGSASSWSITRRPRRSWPRRTPRPPGGSASAWPRPGPGAIHLLNGLYDAKLDHAPVLAITGMQETSVLGTGYQQEVHVDRLYADLAEYNLVVENPAQLPGVVDIAVRTALARRGVAHLTFPNDVQVADADADPYQHVAPARPPATAPVYLPAPGRAADGGPGGGRPGPERRARRSPSWPGPARCTPARRCWRWRTCWAPRSSRRCRARP